MRDMCAIARTTMTIHEIYLYALGVCSKTSVLVDLRPEDDDDLSEQQLKER